MALHDRHPAPWLAAVRAFISLVVLALAPCGLGCSGSSSDDPGETNTGGGSAPGSGGTIFGVGGQTLDGGSGGTGDGLGSGGANGSGGGTGGETLTSGTGGTGGATTGGTGGTGIELPQNTVASPNGRIFAELSTTDGVLRYRITVDGEQILAPSEIGLRTDGVDIGQNASLGEFEITSVDEEIPYIGGRAVAVNSANEASIPITGNEESYTLDVHVADDGVAVRLRLSAKQGRRIEAERSVWRLEGDPTMWVTELDQSYELHYRTESLNTRGGAEYALPVTAKAGELYVSLSESAVQDFGDMAVRAGESGALESFLYADANGWTTDAAVIQPWRVTIIADDLTTLTNSTLVYNLAPPRSVSNTTWSMTAGRRGPTPGSPFVR